MTTLRRTLIFPSDIVAIEYECGHCGSRYSVPVARFDRRVERCPNCQENWVNVPHHMMKRGDDEAVARFIQYLKDIQLSCSSKVTMRLELSEGTDKESPA